MSAQTFSMPLGPVHVALEEPVYFHLDVDGETIRHVNLTSGHVHRGMEAMATQRNLIQNTTLTERVCSLCSNSHSFTYSMAVENVLGIEIPVRARYLRVLAEEIKRVASHLFNTAIQAHVIGFKSLFMHVMEVREMMQDVKETVYGNRMNLASNCIGGVKCDVSPELLTYIRQQVEKMRPAVASLTVISPFFTAPAANTSIAVSVAPQMTGVPASVTTATVLPSSARETSFSAAAVSLNLWQATSGFFIS